MEQIEIPFDIFYHIIPYLEPGDCISFALSGLSPEFSAFYGEKQKWDLKHSYSLEPSSCLRFFSNYLVSESVTVLDLSHMYWFPEDLLHASLIVLENIEELNLVDTDLSLSKFPTVFLPCQSIKRLAISLEERNWKDFSDNLGEGDPGTHFCFWKILSKGLKNLHSFELHWAVDEFSTYETWNLIYRILACCCNCTELFLEVSNPFDKDRIPSILDCPWEEGLLSTKEPKDVVDCMQKKAEVNAWRFLLSELDWMKFLKRFVYVVRGCPFTDKCFDGFCKWFFQDLKPQDLEQIWLPSTQGLMVDFKDSELGSSLTHLCIGRSLQTDLLSTLDKVTHLSGFNLSLIINLLPNLLFVQGYCSSFSELEEFVLNHRKLEHFHFDCDCTGSIFRSENNWSLTSLKSLVYACNHPNPGLLVHFITSSPNLEELHIGRLNGGIKNSATTTEKLLSRQYQKISLLKRLKILTLSGIEFRSGEFLKDVFQQCTLLKFLHISGTFDDHRMDFHRDLCLYLPLAKNLRDFRFQRKTISENTLFQLCTSISRCKLLERLVIIQEDEDIDDLYVKDELSIELWYLISDLKHLVALIIIYPIHHLIAARIYERIYNWFGKTHPLLWHSVSDALSVLYSPSASLAPRIHIDEIATPYSYFHSAPDFPRCTFNLESLEGSCTTTEISASDEAE